MSTLSHQGGIPAKGFSRRTGAIIVGLAVVAAAAYGLTSQLDAPVVGAGTATVGVRTPADIQRFETEGFPEAFSPEAVPSPEPFSPEAMPSRMGAVLATVAAKNDAAWDSKIEFLSLRYSVLGQLSESPMDKANNAWQSRVEYLNERAEAQ